MARSPSFSLSEPTGVITRVAKDSRPQSASKDSIAIADAYAPTTFNHIQKGATLLYSTGNLEDDSLSDEDSEDDVSEDEQFIPTTDIGRGKTKPVTTVIKKPPPPPK